MTTRHMHVSIEGVLANWSNRDICRLFGRPVRDAAAVKRALLGYLADGVKVLPVGERCPGWSDVTGCPGHEEALTAQDVADRINRGQLLGLGLTGKNVDTVTARVNAAGQLEVDAAPAMFYGDGRRGP